MALRTRIVFRWTNLLLLAIPASFVAQQQQWGTGTVFVLLVLSTIPLAGFIAAFTDALANSAGGKWGEIFEAIFGNATRVAARSSTPRTTRSFTIPTRSTGAAIRGSRSARLTW